MQSDASLGRPAHRTPPAGKATARCATAPEHRRRTGDAPLVTSPSPPAASALGATRASRIALLVFASLRRNAPMTRH